MKSREVIIIGIEIARLNISKLNELKLDKREKDEFIEFFKLPAIAKVDRFVHRIKNIRNTLKISHPQALCIFASREYFIEENDDGLLTMRQRSVSVETKKYLLQELIKITSTDPNIIVIAGTLQVQEPTCLSEVKDFLSLFSKEYFQFIKEAEMERENVSADELKALSPEDYFKKNLQMHIHEKEIEEVLKRHDANKEEKIDKITNQCNIIYGTYINRHDKFLPWNEVPKKGVATDTVWAIPYNSYLRTNYEYQDIKFKISICAETGQASSLFPSLPFRFVLSDFCDIMEKHHREETYIFHLDSIRPAAFYTYGDISRHPYIVTMYKTNLCSNNEIIIPVPATRFDEHSPTPASAVNIPFQKEKPMMASYPRLFSTRTALPVLCNSYNSLVQTAKL